MAEHSKWNWQAGSGGVWGDAFCRPSRSTLTNAIHLQSRGWQCATLEGKPPSIKPWRPSWGTGSCLHGLLVGRYCSDTSIPWHLSMLHFPAADKWCLSVLRRAASHGLHRLSSSFLELPEKLQQSDRLLAQQTGLEGITTLGPLGKPSQIASGSTGSYWTLAQCPMVAGILSLQSRQVWKIRFVSDLWLEVLFECPHLRRQGKHVVSSSKQPWDY